MTRAGQILAALRRGAVTSKEIAAQVPTTRPTISVLLCRLADRGLIEKIGVARAQSAGRPFVKWRVRTALSSRPGE